MQFDQKHSHIRRMKHFINFHERNMFKDVGNMSKGCKKSYIICIMDNKGIKCYHYR